MPYEPNMYDSHMHTPLCKHARGEPSAYAAQAERVGLRGITFTCHSPMPEGWDAGVRMTLAQLPQYVDMIGAARDEYAGRVDLRLGLESDYFPGMEAWIADVHDRADFSYILGSVHALTKEFKARYQNGRTRLEYERSYFENLADAAETGLYDCLSHPDVVKIAHPKQYDVADHLDAIRRVLDRIARTGVAMELNTSGLNKSYPEMNPGDVMLKEMALRGIPVVIGSDSHDPHRVGADFDKALANLQNAGYERLSYFLDRERCELMISDVFLAELQPRLV
ncbi:MAG: histidinol-phosphatase [Chloroflexota bacterium]|nr:histidinol-phosphatase [Chloroflexota bacterium]MDE2947414.1 histidinol-phosphatase [Chloroflexota bacterium]